MLLEFQGIQNDLKFVQNQSRVLFTLLLGQGSSLRVQGQELEPTSLMAKNSHVPKFGNWDNDNVPYTAYFENARRERPGVMINPNDPEENPEAFLWGTVGLDTDGDCRPVHAPTHVDPHKSISAERHRSEDHMGHNPQGRNTSFDHRQKRGSRKSTTSEFSSDKSISRNSLMQPGHRSLKSNRKKGQSEGSSSSSPSVPGHSMQRSETCPSDGTHHRTASVPKFGAWDETDPRSGEGFTVIFNKVKEEKQIGSTKLPTIPDQPNSYPDGHRSNGGSSPRSKICCCCPFSRSSN